MKMLDPDQMSWLLDDEPKPILIDRSTLERYADCPAQGQLVELGKGLAGSAEADSGNEVHRIIADAVKLYVEYEPRTRDLADAMMHHAEHSRPDVQPDVIEALRPSVWGIAGMIATQTNGEPRHIDDLIRFDGGDGDRSGQLAWDIGEHDGRPVRLTCEVDLLAATASVNELALYDWKSGRKTWSPTDIKTSFQFGTFYAFIVLANYPACERIRVRVWNTRKRSLTGAVVFERRDMAAMQARLDEAVALYLKHSPDLHGVGVDNAPAWPQMEKCSQCDAARHCPEATGPVRDCGGDLAAAGRQYVAMTAAADQLKKSLTARVDETGEAIDLGDGEWFGRPESKPSSRKTAAKVFQQVDDEEGGDDE